ncbi:holliday junction resolvase [Gordonia phage RedWattleHog]|uniref:Holliday junction resolvase n=1 Tax=Gordonia phage Stormageddon TaxID=2656541 RepID=A0A649VRR2_9CAUD|nr:Holliday junction resolvase [Gordonia phage Stormageddon]QGJ94941.1 holliday junction resolvase [Gordonia phage Stormageddon]QLF83585.1 holliday junction resolvase [Gordonia phage RedWattleHog]
MKEHFKAHEAHVCDVLEVSPTIASGSKWYDTGDGVDRDAYAAWPIQFDAKCTIQRSYSIQRGFMAGAVRKAVESGKRFLLPLRFVDDDGQHGDYVVMPLDDYAELLATARAYWSEHEG